MRGIIALIIIVFIMFSIVDVNSEKKLIPDEAIRLRVVANSNSIYDQNIKMKVKDEVENNVYSLLYNVNDIDSARKIIKNNVISIGNNVNNLLIKNNYNLGYKIDYGNHYFPEKEYKSIKYDAGNYESLLVTLGKGKGDNWWCVLFPPLCLLEAKESSDVEYHFFVKELIDKIFKHS